MRTIKIFLASSEELANDRNAFGNLVRRLDDIYEKRGIRIKLFVWEDADAAYNNRPKQDEYDDEVRASDMFLALFHKKGGEFTIREFDVASDEFRRTGITPKTYVYCRELQDGEEESTALKEFKHHLFNEMGHYWCNYNNEDSLQLHFVMQLQIVENSHLDELKVENGVVRLADMAIARMENLRFAADNPDYQRMKQRQIELPQEIEDARLLIKEHPDIDRYQEKLQKLLDERNLLQDDFDKQQNLLIDTAKRIATLQCSVITDRMRRAIEAFDRGNVSEANIILDEAEKDGDARFADFERKEELRKKEIANIHSDIECLLLQTTTVMADTIIPIQERINKTIELYKKADYRAMHTNYTKERYNDMLFDYAGFLYQYGLYRDAEKIFLRQIQLSNKIYGKDNVYTATSYNNIGGVCYAYGNYSMALDYYKKALEIDKIILGNEHPNIAAIYNNIGLILKEVGGYDDALEYHQKALRISEMVYGEKHPYIATIINNIGSVYWKQGNLPKAIEYHNKALMINERFLGTEHIETARCYENIGTVYHEQGDFQKAKGCYQKALEIKEMILGPDHTETASIYNNYGMLLRDQGDYSLALSYFLKALKIREKNLVYGDRNTITSYNCIITVFDKLGDYHKALEYIEKVLKIREETLGTEHIETSYSYKDLGSVYDELKDYPQALNYYQKALSIWENKLGNDNPQTATLYNIIGMVYQKQDDYDKALSYYEKALLIREKTLGLESEDIADSYNNIGGLYYKMEKYQESLEYYLKSLIIDEKLYGTTHPITIKDYHNIGAIYGLLGNWEKALEFLEKAKEL